MSAGWTPQDPHAQVAHPQGVQPRGVQPQGAQAGGWSPAQAGGWSPAQAGGWPAPPQPRAWSAPTHPGPPTNLLAVLAVAAAAAGATILLGLGSIAAVVLGSIALGQIKRTGADGKVLAVWAIIAGAVTLVALAAATVIGVAGFVSIGQQLAELGP